MFTTARFSDSYTESTGLNTGIQSAQTLLGKLGSSGNLAQSSFLKPTSQLASSQIQSTPLDTSTLQSPRVKDESSDESSTATLNSQITQTEATNRLPGTANVPYIDQPRLINRLANLAGNIPFVGSFIKKLGSDIPLEGWGWVWVDPNRKYQSVSGVVKTRVDENDLLVGTANPQRSWRSGIKSAVKAQPGSFVTHSDFPAVHDSHDQNTLIQVDPGYEGLLSEINEPGQLEIEWETGIQPSEHDSSQVRNPIFPQWVWPSPGDRVWANGSWIYDVGHGKTGDDGVLRFQSEIHPPRAFATMRDQVVQMPSTSKVPDHFVPTGNVPIHVTATDLYIHGDGGYASEILNGGQSLLITGGHAERFSPIDEDFKFQIQLPDKPSDTAIFTASIADGPGNNFNGVEPELSDPRFDTTLGKWVVDVEVPLANSGITPNQVYARHINAGWAYPTNNLHHVQLTLNKMILHEDMDLDPGDAQLTFSWLDVDKAGSKAWQRLSDFDIPTRDYKGVKIPFTDRYFPGFLPHDNTLEEYDDDHGRGNGELNFRGPTFDFYVANGEPVTLRAHAYDQDGFDKLFGKHSSIVNQASAYLNALTADGVDNDPYNILETTIQPPYRGTLHVTNPGKQYEMLFTVKDLGLTPAEVDKRPISNINGPYTVSQGDSITLSSEGSSDPDGSITALQWDFNYDGQNFDVDATGDSPTFSAADLSPSSQTIALRVIDNLGVPTIATSILTITPSNPPTTLDGSGGQKTFVIDAGSGTTTIENFGGVGTGANPSAETLSEADTLKLEGEGLTALNMLLTQNDGDLEITFEGVDNTKIVLKNFALENLDNLTKATGATVDLSNILFDGQTEAQDSFDVINANSNQNTLFNRNSVTFLNDLDNQINGFDNSDDVINGQGGNDKIDGKGGDDWLRGSEGDDILIGGPGNDVLIGGAGDDELTGGLGSDLFVYQTATDQGSNGDIITDFDVNDLLVLSPLFQSLGYSGSDPIGDNLLRFAPVGPTGTDTQVQINLEGTSGSVFAPLVTLKNVFPSSLSSNFNVII